MTVTTNAQKMPTSATIMDVEGLYIVKIDKCLLVPIVRTVEEEQATGEETIEKVVQRAQSLGDLDVCINGVWYDYSYLSAMDGSASTADTKNEGEVLLANGKRYGNPSPEGYYAAQRVDCSWDFGYGNLPPSGFRVGVGGLCPLVINGLKYGVGNKYSKGVPTGAPPVGDPGQKYKNFLVQRNNNKFAALQKESHGVGKSGFGVTQDGTVFVIVQAHAKPGIPFQRFRDIFVTLNCGNAMACDGSDSVFMYRREMDGKVVFKCSPGFLKNASMSVALGFKSFLNNTNR
jgi:hypothetical protein